jgi:uncharacterized membrane protein YccC
LNQPFKIIAFPPLSLKAKHAIKVSLAMVLSYYIALRFSWLSPTWVAISVAMISLGSIGQSLSKGVLRAKGTFVAFAAGLFFLALFPQDRWLMLISLSVFMAFVTYKMTGKNGQYAWFVTGFVTMMIVTGADQSSADTFEYAAYRTLETLTGIGIWTLISVFIWPQSNVNALQVNSRQLIIAQQKLLHAYRSKLNQKNDEGDFTSAHAQAIKCLNQLDQSVAAANFESLEVRDRYQHWPQMKQQSLGYIAMLARLDTGFADTKGINIGEVLPTLDQYLSELDRVFIEALAVLEGESSSYKFTPIGLSVDKLKIAGMDSFQRAAIVVLSNDLQRCAAFITPLLSPLVDDLKKAPASVRTSSRGGAFSLIPLDRDRIQAALFLVACLWAAALIWFYVDPPGHITWLYLLPTIALITAQTQHLKFPLLKLFGISYLLFMPVYVFVMPQLSAFWELGLLIFLLCFLNAYFLSGVAVPIVYLALFNMLGISNEQVYNFASMMNAYLFTLLVMVVLSVLIYILGSPRPEKVFLKMIGRYFHSSEIILSSLQDNPASRSLFTRMYLAYHQQELQLLPAKLGLWGSQIDRSEFPDTSPEQLQAIVTTLQALNYQIEDLCVLRADPTLESSVLSLKNEIRDWRKALVSVLASLAGGDSVASQEELAQKLTLRMEGINTHSEQMINQGARLEAKDARQLYRLLGGFRRLSQEVIVYAGVAGQVNWSDWRRERF